MRVNILELRTTDSMNGNILLLGISGSQLTGYRLRDTGYGIQVTGYRLRDTGYRIQVTGSRVTGSRIMGYVLRISSLWVHAFTGSPVTDQGFAGYVF